VNRLSRECTVPCHLRRWLKPPRALCCIKCAHRVGGTVRFRPVQVRYREIVQHLGIVSDLESAHDIVGSSRFHQTLLKRSDCIILAAIQEQTDAKSELTRFRGLAQPGRCTHSCKHWTGSGGCDVDATNTRHQRPVRETAEKSSFDRSIPHCIYGSEEPARLSKACNHFCGMRLEEHDSYSSGCDHTRCYPSSSPTYELPLVVHAPSVPIRRTVYGLSPTAPSPDRVSLGRINAVSLNRKKSNRLVAFAVAD